MASPDLITSPLNIDEIPLVFSDLAPLPQEDSSTVVPAVASIDYSESFRIAYGYLRAVWKAEERSVRALRLSTRCLYENPANYTVWHFRRQCLDTVFNGSVKDYVLADLQFTALLGGDNPKNYQIWYHRRALLEKLASASDSSLRNKGEEEEVDVANQTTIVGSDVLLGYCKVELEYLSGVLRNDGKNYHAWSHRQWIVRTVAQHQGENAAIWEEELEYATSLIEKDPRNNSAWNQRWFVLHQGNRNASSPASTSPLPPTLESAKSEVEYAISVARVDPYNESPWRYMIALVKEQLKRSTDLAAWLDECIQKTVDVKNVLREHQAKKQEAELALHDPEACVNLQSALIDLYELDQQRRESLETIVQIGTLLSDQYDTVRQKYWRFRVQQIQQRMSSLPPAH